jgi:hypothetical protein
MISLSGMAQNDTIFFMRHGMIVYQKALSEIDSMVFYRPTINPHGSFLDIRDSSDELFQLLDFEDVTRWENIESAYCDGRFSNNGRLSSTFYS